MPEKTPSEVRREAAFKAIAAAGDAAVGQDGKTYALVMGMVAIATALLV